MLAAAHPRGQARLDALRPFHATPLRHPPQFPLRWLRFLRTQPPLPPLPLPPPPCPSPPRPDPVLGHGQHLRPSRRRAQRRRRSEACPMQGPPSAPVQTRGLHTPPANPPAGKARAAVEVAAEVAADAAAGAVVDAVAGAADGTVGGACRGRVGRARVRQAQACGRCTWHRGWPPRCHRGAKRKSGGGSFGGSGFRRARDLLHGGRWFVNSAVAAQS